MAIFKKNKTVKKTKKAAPNAVVAHTPKGAGATRSYAHVLLSPRITEKAGDLSSHNAYVFNVDPRSGKKEIAAAVKAIYGVSPLRVSTVTIRGKATNLRGKKGKAAGGKKAVVYVKKGEKIEFV